MSEEGRRRFEEVGGYAKLTRNWDHINKMRSNMSKDMIDITWILTEAVEVTNLNGNYVVQEQDGDGRQCVITMFADRMRFDGHDIETESFMAYVGLLDMVDEQPAGTPVKFDKDDSDDSDV
jgi:hypothetical protein